MSTLNSHRYSPNQFLMMMMINLNLLKKMGSLCLFARMTPVKFETLVFG